MGKLAVETGAWIMWEKEGDEYRFLGRSKLIAEEKVKRKPLSEWVNPQGRFRPLRQNPKMLAEYERWVDREWEIMKEKVST